MSTNVKTIVLIGFQDQGNLGLGYLASVLLEDGYLPIIVDIKQSHEDILNIIKAHKPILIGFSLIFQYYLPKFKKLAAFLRVSGINCHMTIGGHFPSMCYQQTLQQIPELDSIVRFEGEYSLLAIVKKLHKGNDWRTVKGIAYKQKDQIVTNNLRALITDLDTLPFPYRSSFDHEILGLKIQPILATRGCPRQCSFCSIREFYAQAKGKLVRRRSPANVVQEMRKLYEQNNVRIFLFQDDDFPLVGKAGKKWVYEYIAQLAKNQLLGNIVWKISCRVDELDKQLLEDMKSAGLYLVYLGIESGSRQGLKTLNKKVSIEDNYRAVALLKELDILFGYGFMLFDPSSTFATVLENIQFLRRIIGDGAAAAVFCKMLPYSGTPIEKELIDLGRLTGTVAQPDYNFTDSKLDRFYDQINETLSAWVYGQNALSHNLNLMWHEVALIQRLLPNIQGLDAYINELQSVTEKTNETIFTTIERGVSHYQRDSSPPFNTQQMSNDAHSIINNILSERDSFIRHNQETIIRYLDGFESQTYQD